MNDLTLLMNIETEAIDTLENWHADGFEHDDPDLVEIEFKVRHVEIKEINLYVADHDKVINQAFCEVTLASDSCDVEIKFNPVAEAEEVVPAAGWPNNMRLSVDFSEDHTDSFIEVSGLEAVTEDEREAAALLVIERRTQAWEGAIKPLCDPIVYADTPLKPMSLLDSIEYIDPSFDEVRADMTDEDLKMMLAGAEGEMNQLGGTLHSDLINQLIERRNSLAGIEEFRVERDGDSDLVFRGTQLAWVSSGNHDAPRWTELTVYRTEGGKYVCERVGCTEVEGEKDRCSGAVSDDIDGVIKFFKFGSLSKALYKKAGIETATRVQ